MVSKILAALPRVLLGLVLLASGVVGLLHLAAPPPMEGTAALYMTTLGSTYLFTFVKLTEVVAGLLLLSGFFVPLAVTILAPVMLNILAFHLFYDVKGLPVPLVLLALHLATAWKYRAAFGPLLQAKPAVGSASASQGSSARVTASA